ncbi:MAG: MFS transporter [Planctomycetota bacterium]|jgi:OPA family glycerol-3-phosphate transporter-like MFS transporter
MTNEQQVSIAPVDREAVKHPPGFRGRRGQNWFMLGLMYASYYTCRYNLSIAAPRIMDQFGFSNARYGAINTGRHLAYAFGQFINGLLTDQLGGKQAMAIGALLTIVLNVLFGVSSYAATGSVFTLFLLVRTCDGYAQAFGAPGMIKVNTAWFTRSERGRFAGVFGLMIQVGQITINALGPWLLAGHAIMIWKRTYVIGGGWQWLFWVPPCIVAVVVLIMYAVVRNEPEEVGYYIRHDPAEARADAEHGDEIPLSVVFATIVRKKMVWITACAYFCTGVVRTAQYDWWVLYFSREWGLDIKTSTLVIITGGMLPISAFFGSISSGFISDLLFKGKRAPVAMVLYALESAVILAAALLLSNVDVATPALASVLLILISLTCNSTHSILGTAAAMDLGGRKMAGFAAGVIDSFQYFGAATAGLGLGKLIDYTVQHTALGWNAWFYFMLPFSLIGMCLMGYVWYRTHGRDVVAG